MVYLEHQYKKFNMEKKRRNYEKKTIKPRWRYEGRLYPGLKKVHIGEDVWLIGRPKKIKDGRMHQVIYGPDNKEYHVYGVDVEEMGKPFEHSWKTDSGETYCIRHGNKSLENKVKIYILTQILDDKENWCFDLTKKPAAGSKVKIIYDNGTVKIVDYFTGEFEKAELISKRWVAPKNSTYWPEGYVSQKFVVPIAYRIN